MFLVERSFPFLSFHSFRLSVLFVCTFCPLLHLCRGVCEEDPREHACVNALCNFHILNTVQILGQISLTNQKHQSSSQKVYVFSLTLQQIIYPNNIKQSKTTYIFHPLYLKNADVYFHCCVKKNTCEHGNRNISCKF